MGFTVKQFERILTTKEKEISRLEREIARLSQEWPTQRDDWHKDIGLSRIQPAVDMAIEPEFESIISTVPQIDYAEIPPLHPIVTATLEALNSCHRVRVLPPLATQKEMLMVITQARKSELDCRTEIEQALLSMLDLVRKDMAMLKEDAGHLLPEPDN